MSSGEDRDNLHEAESHLRSSGINPDHHVYQSILHLILEIRRIRETANQGKKHGKTQEGSGNVS